MEVKVVNPRVREVRPNDDYTLTIEFTNGETRVFDVKPYLNKGVFKELNDLHLFKTVKVFDGTVQWVHDQDFCPDTLYMKGVPVQQEH